MRILITNDDGLDSVGLKTLCEALSKEHEVYVVAPNGQRSAFSHAISFHKEIFFDVINDYCGVKKCFSSSGTPADCAKFGIEYLSRKVDCLICGPNISENYGNDIVYSGTVGAAEEGALCGIRTIAISKLTHETTNFESCAIFVKNNLDYIISLSLDGSFLNVNVPNLPYSEIKGVKVVKQGHNKYHDYYIDGDNGGYILTGYKQHYNLNLKDDVACSENGYITITPLKIDQTNYTVLKRIKDGFKK